jgi:uncharacterized protein YebE (UPF0316 family)
MHTFRPLLIGGLVVTEVAIWQWRMVIAHRGRRIVAMLLGVIGAALQITAITQVVAGVHDVLSIAAYAGGVGCGVLFGLVAGDRLTPGRLEVTIISAIPGLDEALWRSGWSATAHQGQSRQGPVTTVHIDIDRGEEPRLRQDTGSIDPLARWVTKEIRSDSSNRTGATRFAWSRRLWTMRARSRVQLGRPREAPALRT